MAPNHRPVALLTDSETQLTGDPRAQRAVMLEVAKLHERGLHEMANTMAARVTRARQHELSLRKLRLEKLRASRRS